MTAIPRFGVIAILSRSGVAWQSLEERTMTAPTHTRSAQIRDQLDHPVIVGDGHWLESLPILEQYVDATGGPKTVDALRAFLDSTKPWYDMSVEERLRQRFVRPLYWGEAGNTLDRATALLPRLMHERLPEMGIDFAFIYPTLGLFFQHLADPDIRRAILRAENTMAADLFRPYADRLAPVAAIPVYTPQEAIEEADYAVRTLGMKAIMVYPNVKRPIETFSADPSDINRVPYFIDPLALDSPYDYDPFWAKCLELGVAVTCHGQGSLQWPNRQSISNMNFNHTGHFAEANHAFCKAVFFGGVQKRFPELRFAFLEGGVAWAIHLYSDLVDHWEKRGAENLMKNQRPLNLDLGRIRDLIQQYGGDSLAPHIDAMIESISTVSPKMTPQELTERELPYLDEYAALDVHSADDVRSAFRDGFYFGCEADDRLNALAFDARLGLQVKALFSSDIGHFDVPQMSAVVEEAFELVEDGVLSRDDFRRFMFTNVAELHLANNPRFFEGTVVELAVAQAAALTA